MRNALGKWNNQTQSKPAKSKFESAPMPKDGMSEAEGFDSWRSQHQHQGYSTTVSASNMQDPYNAGMPSYYGMSFPYQNVGMGGGEGPWSSGGDPMTFLGSYGQQLSSDQQHYMDSSMYSSGAFGGFNQPGYNQFYGMSDYSAWGNSSVNRKPATHGHYEDYYRDVYSEQGVDRTCVKPVEQAMQGLSIVDKSDSNQGAEGGSEFTGRGAVLDGSSIPKKTWASIASQPAKLQPKMRSKGMPPSPMIPGKHVDIGTWDSRSANSAKPMNALQSSRAPLGAPRGRGGASAMGGNPSPSGNPNQNSGASGNGTVPQHPVLDKLRQSNEYNPKDYDLGAKNARFFVIKSYSEDDIHRSIKYGIWCSTEHGNKRLDQAFRERENKGPVLLFFSVNGSGHFCGMAMMVSALDYNSTSSVWAQDKWKGEFMVKWIYVKDVPNAQLRHIRLENNENKPVTNSRDTQEVPYERGKQVLKIMHSYRHSTSIFDDFIHYEQRQEEGTQHGQPEEEQL